MSLSVKCGSCGMPMNGPAEHAPGKPDSEYCVHCSTPEGELQDFKERFERMTQWAMRKSAKSREDAEAETKRYMGSMPLWKNHPALKA